MIVGVKRRRNSRDIYGLGQPVFRVERNVVRTFYNEPFRSNETHLDKIVVKLFEPRLTRWGNDSHIWTNSYQVVEICDFDKPATCGAERYEKCPYRFKCFTASTKGLDN